MIVSFPNISARQPRVLLVPTLYMAPPQPVDWNVVLQNAAAVVTIAVGVKSFLD